jgi:hypothetical protein
MDNKNLSKNINPVVAGVAKTTIIAGAVLTAVALSKKENRRKLAKLVNNIREDGENIHKKIMTTAKRINLPAQKQSKKRVIKRVKRHT